jgi:hypothetical protein
MRDVKPDRWPKRFMVIMSGAGFHTDHNEILVDCAKTRESVKEVEPQPEPANPMGIYPASFYNKFVEAYICLLAYASLILKLDYFSLRSRPLAESGLSMKVRTRNFYPFIFSRQSVSDNSLVNDLR